MQFNSYHPETREYLGVVAAQSNPKREGEFLMPAFATPIALPEEPLPEGCVWQLGDGEWNAVEDHRGETVYSTADQTSLVVDYLGPIKPGFTPLVPQTPDDDWDGQQWVTPSPDAEDLYARAADRRWRAETGGMTWNGWMQATSDRGQAKVNAALQEINEGARDDGDPWKFAHGFEALTNAQMHDLVIAVRAFVKSCYGAEEQIRGLIADGTITSYDGVENWSGWPS